MKKLLFGVPITQTIGEATVEASDFTSDSRAVQNGTLFIAVPGFKTDGHNYIAAAVENGATAVLCERLPENLSASVTYILTEDAAAAYSLVAANYYGRPAERLTIVGVTGTNGKTTIATLLYRLFTELGYPTGLISTIEVKVKDESRPAVYTTPDAKLLQSYFREMADAGCAYCFMEVSSHALAQRRTFGVPFSGAIFTNITHDHLDFHKTFANYIKAKKILFDDLKENAFALTNLDDRNGSIVTQNTHAVRLTYSLQTEADFRAKIIESRLDGLLLNINEKEAWFRLIGKFNAYNLLAVWGAACALEIDPDLALVTLSALAPVDGRFQAVPLPQGRKAVVDYAHTPDALENVLVNLEELTPPENRIITVVGCGGDRDPYKRPDMARIAALHSNLTVLTSDNPRSESPEAIIEQMFVGVPESYRANVHCIVNRRAALRQAATLSRPGDVILIAGKGHETYQEIQGTRLPFDDRIEIIAAFENN